MSNLNTTSIGDPLPPLNKQQAILTHHRSELDLIDEYRTQLTSDVVTDKLDVRGSNCRRSRPSPESEPVM